ncbi:hypothetical protein GCM10017600_31320 [Streptosporangium carneum]|uniref:Uncharacterized protein n=1 Tax=Streptosporangium carneum TaxID=47481 RepID=A0A9W6I1L0_9ACTN|nr:hypothetical protein GCM10017600_31320 [Streptosporangium carneum]
MTDGPAPGGATAAGEEAARPRPAQGEAPHPDLRQEADSWVGGRSSSLLSHIRWIKVQNARLATTVPLDRV